MPVFQQKAELQSLQKQALMSTKEWRPERNWQDIKSLSKTLNSTFGLNSNMNGTFLRLLYEIHDILVIFFNFSTTGHSISLTGMLKGGN